jgi:acyl carrier protein
MKYSPEELQKARSVKATPTETVEEVVKKVVEYNLAVSPDDMKMESRIIEDLGADSLDSVEIIIHLEEETGFTIEESFDDDAIKSGTTVADLIMKVAEVVLKNSDEPETQPALSQ